MINLTTNCRISDTVFAALTTLLTTALATFLPTFQQSQLADGSNPEIQSILIRVDETASTSTVLNRPQVPNDPFFPSVELFSHSQDQPQLPIHQDQVEPPRPEDGLEIRQQAELMEPEFAWNRNSQNRTY